MTRERKQDVFLLALAASLFMHAALVLVMRPRVMTHVAPDELKARPRRTMHAIETPKRPETAAFADVGDLEAAKSAPDAPTAAETRIPPAATGTETSPERTGADAPALPPPSPSPEDFGPQEKAVPMSAPKMAAEAASADYRTVLPDVPMETPTRPAAPERARLEPSWTAAAAPMASEPSVASAVPESAPQMPVDALPAAESARDAGRTVRSDVLPHVDEAVVDEEKKAVRALLNVRRAKELDAAVKTTVSSAAAGDWVYFSVKMEPRGQLEVVPKDFVVLLDASGSIGGDRLGSCRKAARRILRSATNTGDRFNLVAFRDRYSYAFASWQPCDAASFGKADRWLSNLAAHGRTDVFATIKSVLTLPRDPARPLIALVVTDGDATAGVSETAEILSRFTALNDGLVSVYMYGVKSGANRELIDVLTQGNRGESFVHEGFRWHAGEGIEAFGARFRDPVLSDLRIVPAQGAPVELYPRLLRNLYRGTSVTFVGRVRKGTPEVAFSVRALNGRQAYEGFCRVRPDKAVFDANVPREWERLRQIDLHLQ